MAILCALFCFLKRVETDFTIGLSFGDVGVRMDGYLPFLLIIGVIGAAASIYAYGHICGYYKCYFP